MTFLSQINGVLFFYLYVIDVNRLFIAKVQHGNLFMMLREGQNFHFFVSHQNMISCSFLLHIIKVINNILENDRL